jgi:hypothetical protein
MKRYPEVREYDAVFGHHSIHSLNPLSKDDSVQINLLVESINRIRTTYDQKSLLVPVVLVALVAKAIDIPVWSFLTHEIRFRAIVSSGSIR